jgi:hypothetical protein
VEPRKVRFLSGKGWMSQEHRKGSKGHVNAREDGVDEGDKGEGNRRRRRIRGDSMGKKK